MIFLKMFFIFNFFLLSLFATNLKKVSLQLQWKYQFQFAGYIMAKEKGFYNNVGLDVTLKEWEHGINMVDEVTKGNSEFAISRPTALIDIAKGKDIIFLASIFQSSPLILLTDESTGIKTIKDFKNKRIMTTGDLNVDTSLLSMMYSQGIDAKDLITQVPSFKVKDLIDNKTDLIASYISNEPFQLKELGGTPVIFSPKDYGFEFYNDILITSNEYLKNNPTEVKNFREATLEGWEYAFDHIDETINIINQKYNNQKKSINALNYEAKELKKLAYYHVTEIGKIESRKLEKIYDVYKLLGLVRTKINFNEVIYSDKILNNILTKEEKQYLLKKEQITMCVDPDWLPFEEIDEKGKHIGISADFYKIISKNLDTSFKLIKTDSWNQTLDFGKKRKCDIFSLAMETPKRKEYMNFTSPYLTIPLVIATKSNVPFINDILDITGKDIGITKGYAFVELLRNKYPTLNIIETENIDDALEKVNNGELFAYIGTLASTAYKFQTKYSGELKIAGKIGDHWELGIAVRNDDLILLNIMQKAIDNISYKEKRKILNEWISVKYQKGVDYTLLYKAIAIFTFTFAILLFFYSKQKKLKDELEIAYKELEKLAVIDKLTKLYNRYKIDEVLESEKERSNRYKTPFGILMLDIDHFKNVNDTYGHSTGDEVLKRFAKIIKENSRKTDIVGRWGGEEFLIIIPHTDKNDLLTIAENLRSKIGNYKFKTIGNLTVSIGASIYEYNESTEKTIIRADNALYSSKENGRNKVTYK